MKARRCIVVLGAIASTCVPPAVAQTKKQVEARYSNTYNRCMNTGLAAQGVTSGIMDCSGSEIRRQDARLNQTYTQVMARSSPRQKTKLRASERAWITKRDTGCQQETAPLDGGTLAMILFSGCVLDETIRRTIWLESYSG